MRGTRDGAADGDGDGATSGLPADALLRAMPDAIVICSPDGVIVEVNDQVRALLGYERSEVVGRPVEMLVPDAFTAAHRGHRARYTAAAHAQPMITGPGISARHKDGRDVPVEVNLAAAELDSGPVVVASVRDASQVRAAESRMRDSLDLVTGILSAATEQAVIATDLEGRIETFSRGAELLLGYTADEVLGQRTDMLRAPGADVSGTWGVPADSHTRDRVAALVQSGVATTRAWQLRAKSGELREVLLSVTVRQAGGVPAGLILVATDQAERRARDAALAASEERFRLAFVNAPIGVGLVSIEAPTAGRVLQVNPALEALLGYSAAELTGTTVARLAHPEDLPLVAATLERLMLGEPVTELIEHRFLRADGRTVWAQVSLASVMPDQQGGGAYVVAMLTDVTARREAEAELMFNALHDGLTGLPNRALITEHLAGALNRARHSGTDVGLLYVDLDNFKDVNDSLGHAAGDELLVEVGRRLAGALEDQELAGRLGGDEFVVVSEDVRTVEELTAVADRVARALAIQLPLAGQMVTASASIGIARRTSPHTTAEDLLREADIAMYRAKANGRARYEFSDPGLQVRALRQIELEADLRATLAVQWPPSSADPGEDRPAAAVRIPEEGRLFLDYQPCFDARDGRLIACEALLRWEHPTLGVLAPGQFLDVAEDRALMSPLGSWVLEEAARQAARWYAQHGDLAPEMWVNVSAAQMGRHAFAQTVADVLARTGLPAHLLCVELTERHALSSAPDVLDDLCALPAIGVRLAIDDFGTGYAGLEYLRRLPASTLKVDASYVAAIGRDRAGAALVSTVVNLGHALDLTVVAEGVETAAQREAVTALGADILQGFHLGRPGPPARIDQRLAELAVPQH
ncbi:EAL domain-containing protein [Cellulomonas sp.]|uniref:sensor domain-containing protein n=1 Tax=Cellulomonas sp. TaxID=40001 RepID=UPI00258BE1BE|nr:EAL domain-containing protein [Cellulomonas sp.]MCR6688919.1 EAL domain-containing protein [Cellulomonas sp.]